MSAMAFLSGQQQQQQQQCYCVTLHTMMICPEACCCVVVLVRQLSNISVICVYTVLVATCLLNYKNRLLNIAKHFVEWSWNTHLRVA